MNKSSIEAVERYYIANHYLNEGLIRTGNIDSQKEKKKRKSCMPSFLEAFDNPQKGIPAIHIAGTSGKGTTALMIAKILQSAGIRCGLHISPYLQVSTEKIWIDGLYYHPNDFADLIEELKPTIESFRPQNLPLHGMSSILVALEAFRRAKVDIIVFETGVGGRTDLSNNLDTLISVITKIGFDHQKTLGKTISEIAYHKAGIIKPGIPSIAFSGPGKLMIRKEAKQLGSQLLFVVPNVTYRNVRNSFEGTAFSYFGKNWEIRNVFTVAKGPFQVENASIAIAVAEKLSELGYKITPHHVTKGLLQATLPGRIEIVSKSPLIILDGAHNSDKILNLLKYRKFIKKKEVIVICGILAKKMKRKIVTRLMHLSSKIITTEPKVYAKSALPADFLAKAFKRRGIKDVMFIPDPMKAFETVFQESSSESTIIITGSLYLVGTMRNFWYSEKEILLQRTSYPTID